MRKLKTFLLYLLAIAGLVCLGLASFFFFKMGPVYVERLGYTPAFWLPLRASRNDPESIRERNVTLDISIYKGRYPKTALKVLTPLSELSEPSPFGMVPKVSKDGKRAKDVYSKTAKSNPFPEISILIIDLGLDLDTLDTIIQVMPSDVSLSFSPYTENMESAVSYARKNGFETYLDLPLEPLNASIYDLGPMALLTSVPETDNQNKLMQILAKNCAYSGVTAIFGEAFASSPQAEFIADEIERRGLFFIDATGPGYKGTDIRGTEFLLNEQSKDRILQKLSVVRQKAKQNGKALLVLRPKPAFLYYTLMFIQDLKTDESVNLVPLSNIIKPKE